MPMISFAFSINNSASSSGIFLPLLASTELIKALSELMAATSFFSFWSLSAFSAASNLAAKLIEIPAVSNEFTW